jgi:hypothetical protein
VGSDSYLTTRVQLMLDAASDEDKLKHLVLILKYLAACVDNKDDDATN